MKPDKPGTGGVPGHVSRRSFLQAGARGAGLAAVAPRAAWGQDRGDAKRGGTLVVRSGPLRGIDPHLETWGAALQVIHQTYNALLKFNHDGTKMLPDLAESWEQKDDLTYSFKLRQGVRFHNVPPVNGRELTSEDVKYSIERQMTDQPGKFQHAYFFLGKLASIQTPDKYTVVFKTKEPYAPFLNYIANPWTVIVAREVVEKHGDLQRHAIGTGPFVMQEYRREQEAVFVKNPSYFKKGLPYLDEVRIQYVIDPVAATAAVRGHQTDTELIAGSPGDNVKRAQVVKDQLPKVGIQVNLKPLEMAQYYNKSYSYDYSMSVHTALPGEDPEEAIRPSYGANAPYYRWGNREIHRLIDEQAKILDLKKRVDMVHQIQRLLLDDAPNVFLYTPITHYGVQPWVKNYTVPINAYDQRYEEIWLDGKKA